MGSPAMPAATASKDRCPMDRPAQQQKIAHLNNASAIYVVRAPALKEPVMKVGNALSPAILNARRTRAVSMENVLPMQITAIQILVKTAAPAPIRAKPTLALVRRVGKDLPAPAPRPAHVRPTPVKTAAPAPIREPGPTNVLVITAGQAPIATRLMTIVRPIPAKTAAPVKTQEPAPTNAPVLETGQAAIARQLQEEAQKQTVRAVLPEPNAFQVIVLMTFVVKMPAAMIKVVAATAVAPRGNVCKI